jgi:lipoate-protein ligase A
MIVYYSEDTDPYFNLAAEAFFLHHLKDDVLFIWRSNKAVVCGKHQNVCAEVNFAHCIVNGISVCRRLSGGGTVYHDLGNINFTFIKNLNEGLEKAVNYKQFLNPVRDVLFAMGIKTEYSLRDDLLLNNYKVSGNAQHIFQKGMRILHHGTLLYDSDLLSLGKALRSQGNYIGKAIKSVRSEVTNIRNWVDFGSVDIFLKKFLNEIEKRFNTSVIALEEKHLIDIDLIKNQKFALNSWVLGYSPNYNHKRQLEWGNILLNLDMTIEKGIVQNIEIYNFNRQKSFEQECQNLLGMEFNMINVKNVFNTLSFDHYIQLF